MVSSGERRRLITSNGNSCEPIVTSPVTGVRASGSPYQRTTHILIQSISQHISFKATKSLAYCQLLWGLIETCTGGNF